MNAALAIRHHIRWSGALKVAGAIALAVISALIAAYFTYAFTARLNIESAVQQQQSAAVQQFEESGARLDTSLSLFTDALLDKKGISDARKEVRTALVIHAAQTGSLRNVVGNGNVDQYLNGLQGLRQFADETTNPKTAMKTAQEHVYLMSYRAKLIAMARKNIYI